MDRMPRALTSLADLGDVVVIELTTDDRAGNDDGGGPDLTE
jgi:hypothetical protein